MEEYEVDLRDYLRVMWEEKWVILGVFLVAISAALLLSFRTPSRYEDEAVVRLNHLPQIAEIQLSASSAQTTLVLVMSTDLLARTAAKTELAEADPFRNLSQGQLVEWLRSHLSASIPQDTSLIQLKIAAALHPRLLQQFLNEHLRALEERLTEDLHNDVEQEIVRITSEEEVLRGQRERLIEEVEREISAREAILERQRAELLARLDTIEQDKGKLGLPAGEENATLEGIILKEQFTALNWRLQQVEREMDNLERTGREMFPALNSRIQDLDQELQQFQIAVAKAQRLLNPGWQPLDIVDQPSAPMVAIGPNRKMNVAIAGVMGLFVGVLLAFLIHYLRDTGKVTSEEE